MANVYAYRLKKNYESILRDLEPRQVLNYLYQEDVIDGDLRDEIRAERTRKRQAEVLLDILARGGTDAIEHFIVGLQKSSQKHLVEYLQKPLANESSGMVQSMHDPVDCYSMDRNPCGLAFIINNYAFNEGTTLEHREGAVEDVEKMRRLFARLRFKVIRKSNLTCAEINGIIRRLMLEDHTQFDCFVLFIMSHGNKDGIYGTDGKVVRIQEDITMKFNPKLCPTLANKPKLFFFQACRGPSPDRGVTVMEGPRVGTSRPVGNSHGNLPQPEPETEDTETRFQTLVPHDADIFIGFASSPTRAALRNTETGGWFVNELYEVMWKYAEKEDLLTMMTRVNGRVTRRKTNRDNYMQCPEQHNRLGKKLYFRPRPAEEFSQVDS